MIEINPDDPQKKRDFWSVATGIGGAVTGWIGSTIYLNTALQKFKKQLANLVRNDEVNTRTGGLGAGLDAEGIRNSHFMDLIEKEENKLPRFLYRMGGEGIFNGGIAVITGAIAALSYRALTPKPPVHSSRASFEDNSDNYSHHTPKTTFADKVSPNKVEPKSITLEATGLQGNQAALGR